MHEHEMPGPINHPPYGIAILRAFGTPLGWLRSRCVAAIANQIGMMIAPRHFEFLDLGHDESKWHQRLEEEGFTPPFRVLKGLTRYIGLIEYCGTPFPDRIRAARARGDRDTLARLIHSLARVVGGFHRAAIIADDTHPDQFVVHENDRVRRIDLDNGRPCRLQGRPAVRTSEWVELESRLPMVFLTEKGFDVGRQVEWRIVRECALLLASEQTVRRLQADEVTADEVLQTELVDDYESITRTYELASDLPVPRS